MLFVKSITGYILDLVYITLQELEWDLKLENLSHFVMPIIRAGMVYTSWVTKNSKKSMVHRRSFYSITKMNLELLALLLPSSPEPEIRSTSHDSLTAQDVCHLLANRNLSNDEYTLLLSKFIQDKSAMGDLYNTMNKVSSVLFAERYQYTDEDCSEFISCLLYTSPSPRD